MQGTLSEELEKACEALSVADYDTSPLNHICLSVLAELEVSRKNICLNADNWNLVLFLSRCQENRNLNLPTLLGRGTTCAQSFYLGFRNPGPVKHLSYTVHAKP